MQTLCEKKGDSSMKGKAYKEIEGKIKTFLNCTNIVVSAIRMNDPNLTASYLIGYIRDLKTKILQRELSIKEMIEFKYIMGNITWDEHNCLWKYATKESKKLMECCKMLERELMEIKEKGLDGC